MNVKFSVSGRIDVVSLFLHDKYDCKELAENYVAEEIGRLLNEATSYSYPLSVIAPEDSGLDRFIVEIGDQRYTSRCHSESDLRSVLPDFVFDAIKAITTIGERPR